MRKLSKLKPSNKKSPAGSFADQYRQATELIQMGRSLEAIPLLEAACEQNPDHFQANLNLSAAYILTNQFKLAVPVLEKLRDKEPNNVMIWANLGAAYLGNPILAGAEQQQQAIAAFKTALEFEPFAANMAYNLGLIYRDRQEIDQAIYWFEQALEADPDDDDARSILARLKNNR